MNTIVNPLAQWVEGAHYGVTADLLSDGWLVLDTDLTPLYFSPSLQTLLGWQAKTLRRLWRFWQRHPAVPKSISLLQSELVYMRQLFQQDPQLHSNSMVALNLTTRLGANISVEPSILSLHDGHGRLGAMLLLVRDVTARNSARSQMGLAQRVFENSLTAMYVTNAEGKIERVNQAFCRMTGYSVQEVVGHSPALLDVGRYSSEFFDAISHSLTQRGFWEGELQHRHKSGRVFPAAVAITELRDDGGNVTHRITSFSDITERKNSDSKIQQLAYFDPLTQLPNRSLLLDRLERAIARAKRSGQYVAVFFLDLDQFKQVNDLFGHNVGDELLRFVAQRLSGCVRNEDTVARLSGDEFVVVLTGLKDKASAVHVATRMAESFTRIFARPIELGREVVSCSCSVGIALFPEDGAEVSMLLRHADKAMYYIKHHGKRSYKFFTPALENSSVTQLNMSNALQRALDMQEFVLHYQPILDTESGSVVALEALLRWQHPQRGLLLPAEFIGALEQGELFLAVSEWVFNAACEQMQRWRRQGTMVRRVSVNVSEAQFQRTPLVNIVREALAETGLPPECLEIEIRESALMRNIDKSLETLQALRRLGVMIALDNFGQGSSSMSLLKRLPMNRLKVDRGFVGGLPGREDQQMVGALVSLGHSLSLRVVGEGVETPAQLAFLQKQGCEEVQGYLLSKPQAAADLNLHVH